MRLHLLRTDRFTTTWCRVALHRDLGAEAAATAVLAQVLGSATARHPTREALAHRLADLYGASLSTGVEKLGDRQLLVASLEWPTAHVPGPERLLAEGLGLLREVLAEPLRQEGGALDADLVRTEQVNHVRALRALRDDKGRYALRRCLEVAFQGEAFGLDPLGTEAHVARLTPEGLAALQGRLLARAPVDVFLVGDVGTREAVGAVRRHLTWPGRAARPMRVPPAGSVRAARARPRRIVERDRVTQGKLAMAFRAPLRPSSPLGPAASTLAGVLGGGPYARLFKVVREVHGLSYYASAGWHRAKGLLLVQSGFEPRNEPRVRRLVRELLGEVASGRLDPQALEGFREAAAHRVAALRDDRGAAVGWAQEALALGLDPSPSRALEALRAVTPAEVRAVGRRLGLDTTFFLTALGAPSRPAAAPSADPSEGPERLVPSAGRGASEGSGGGGT